MTVIGQVREKNIPGIRDILLLILSRPLFPFLPLALPLSLPLPLALFKGRRRTGRGTSRRSVVLEIDEVADIALEGLDTGTLNTALCSLQLVHAFYDSVETLYHQGDIKTTTTRKAKRSFDLLQPRFDSLQPRFDLLQPLSLLVDDAVHIGGPFLTIEL